MRTPILLGLLLLLPMAQAASPTLSLYAAPRPNEDQLVEPSTPGGNQTFDGEFRVELPPESDCTNPISYSIQLMKATGGTLVRPQPANGTLDPTQRVHVLPFVLHVTYAKDAEAYSRIDIDLRASTGACGNLSPHAIETRTGTEMAYQGNVLATLSADEPTAWNIRFVNDGNARARVEPAVFHNGRTLRTIEPFILEIHEVRYAVVPKEGYDPAYKVTLEVPYRYAGNYSQTPNAQSTSVDLYNPEPARGRSPAPSLALLCLGLFLGLVHLRRRRA